MKLHLRGRSLIFIIILLILYFIIYASFGTAEYIIINEVMINPSEPDQTNEWIELYNPTNQPINISQWTITDNSQTDTLEPFITQDNKSMIIRPYQYCIITDKDTTLHNHTSIPSETLLVTVDDSSIGNGLGNENDRIIITNTTGYQIDAIEWGENDNTIPGNPFTTIEEAFTLIRTTTIDTNDTYTDFQETLTPTPGQQNIYTPKGSITITMAPTTIPKIYHTEPFGLPISIHIHLENFSAHTTYDMKVAIKPEETTTAIASQTWDNTQWTYSDRYLFTITTNETGCYDQWAHLRFNNKYKAYTEQIIHQLSAFLHVKIRDSTRTIEQNKEIALLDMDTSTSNALSGGYYVTTLTASEFLPLTNTYFYLTNKQGDIISIYSCENNSIDEGITPEEGFLKLPGPTGSNYSLYMLDKDNHVHLIQENINITQGRYQSHISIQQSRFNTTPQKSITIHATIQNTGTFNDTYRIHLNDISHGWYAKTTPKTVTIPAQQQRNITIQVLPHSHQRFEFKSGTITLFIQSTIDLDSKDTQQFFFETIGPDLTIPTIKTYDSAWNELTTIHQGHNLKIKAYCKNNGDRNASNVQVRFYYDTINETHFIGSKTYESIGSYQKYPSITLDTGYLSPGIHHLIVVVDNNNTIKEIDEYNNEHNIEIEILNTTPTHLEKELLITAFYYYNHPGIANEYITIYNPTNTSLNLTGFFITNTPFKNYEKQCIIRFPDHTTISPYSHLTITQQATAFYNETGYYPDFEYEENTIDTILQMNGSTSFTMSNSGDKIALKNPYNHTIDFICYGNTSSRNHKHWNQSSIPIGLQGQYYKRIQQNNTYIDTNTPDDFDHSRLFFIGQTTLEPISIQGEISCTVFTSPDSSYQAIMDAISHAQKHIKVNMYEFTNPHLCSLLIDCLLRNINITILMEGSPVGGITDEEWYLLNRLSQYGAEIYYIIQDSENNSHARYPFNHAKYVIIDESTVIIESCNWAETGVPVHPSFGNREWGISIHNETIASHYAHVFSLDCNTSRNDIADFSLLDHIIPERFYMDTDIIYGPYEHPFSQKTYTENMTITSVFSPDTSLTLIQSLIKEAQQSIYIQQLYIYPEWDDTPNPLVEELITKAQENVSIKIILNYNPSYKDTNEKCNRTKMLFEQYGIEVQYMYTNESPFTNMHNKGMIIDNSTVLISSINWNENSCMRNREAGVIIKSSTIASYYTEVFFYDWYLNDEQEMELVTEKLSISVVMPDNIVYIIGVFTLTFIVIARDWRQRKWE